MSVPPELYWHAGLLLEPEHLEVMQRRSERLGARVSRLACYQYGVRKPLDLAFQLKDHLESWRVDLSNCDVILPDGTHVVVGQTADIQPDSFRDRSFGEGQVNLYLAVPSFSDRHANVGLRDDAETGRRARFVRGVAKLGGTAGKHRELDVQRLNARLVVATEKPRDSDWLKIGELQRRAPVADGEKVHYELSREFVPPCISLDCEPRLTDILDSVVGNIDRFRNTLANRVAGTVVRQGETEKRDDIEARIQLQALCQALVVVQQIAGQPLLHPFAAHLELARTVGILACFGGWEPPALRIYDHDDPLRSFHDVQQAIEKLLDPKKLSKNYREVDFEIVKGRPRVTIPHDFLRASSLLLCVQTSRGEEQVVKDFEYGRTKVASPTDMQDVIMAATTAVGCAHVPSAQLPPSLAKRSDCVFFRLDCRGKYWDAIEKQVPHELMLAGDVTDDKNAKFRLYGLGLSG